MQSSAAGATATAKSRNLLSLFAANAPAWSTIGKGTSSTRAVRQPKRTRFQAAEIELFRDDGKLRAIGYKLCHPERRNCFAKSEAVSQSKDPCNVGSPRAVSGNSSCQPEARNRAILAPRLTRRFAGLRRQIGKGTRSTRAVGQQKRLRLQPLRSALMWGQPPSAVQPGKARQRLIAPHIEWRAYIRLAFCRRQNN
jgi:hypothetical protein